MLRMTRRRHSANTLAVVPEPLSASVAMLCELSFFCTVGIVLNLACSRIVRTVEPHFDAPPEVGYFLVHGWGPHLVPDLAQNSFRT